MTTLAAGKPSPLGASYDGKGVNFTLFSAHAERVELCVFDAQGNEQRFDLPARTGDIWHGWLPAAGPGLRYGYRVHGPWIRRRGTALTRPSCCSTRAVIRVEGDCPMMSVSTAAIFLPIIATARRLRQSRRWWICVTTGRTMRRRHAVGPNGLSKPMSKG
jgi:hypothetical protein